MAERGRRAELPAPHFAAYARLLVTEPLPTDSYTRTDPGRVRTNNEDAVGMMEPADAAMRDERGALYVVADGMGGHAAGEVASNLAVERIVQQYYALPWDGPDRTLAAAIQQANAEVHAEGQRNPDRQGMGSTVVAAAVLGDRAIVANVGDSRAYLVHDGRLEQLTVDHSWVAERVADGSITADEAATHPLRNIITRNLGSRPFVEADVEQRQMTPGDRLLLCSDGLWGVVPEDEIVRIATSGAVGVAGGALVDAANAMGSPDNVTVALVEMGGSATPAAPTERIAAIAPAPASSVASTQPVHPVAAAPSAPPPPPAGVPPAPGMLGPAAPPLQAAAAPPVASRSVSPASAPRRNRLPLVGGGAAALAALAVIVLLVASRRGGSNSSPDTAAVATAAVTPLASGAVQTTAPTGSAITGAGAPALTATRAATGTPAASGTAGALITTPPVVAATPSFCDGTDRAETGRVPYCVKSNDNPETIARTCNGGPATDAAYEAAILTLNPWVVQERADLKVGQLIWLPAAGTRQTCDVSPVAPSAPRTPAASTATATPALPANLR